MIQRIFSSLFTLLVISIVSFAAIELAPGDPGELVLGAAARDIPPETLQRINAMYRFDLPAHKRFMVWAKTVGSGDLGVSLKTNRPVVTEFMTRIPVSAVVALGSLVIACIVGLTLGIAGVLHENGWIDHVVRILSVTCSSMPVFLIGLFLLYIFSFRLGLFPLYGTDNGSGYILPIATLGCTMGISLSRIFRNSLLGAIHREYFLAAIGKGLSYHKAVIKHGVRNALTPAVTFLALRFAGLLGGIVLIETVFSLPGMGSYIFEAIYSRDYPVIQGYILFFGSIVILVNLCADIILRIIDPRPAQSRLQ